MAPGTQTGEVLHLKGLGVPRLRGRGRGDLYVHVVVETPTGLGEAQRQLLVSLAEARDEHLEAPSNGDGLFSKLRSALS